MSGSHLTALDDAAWESPWRHHRCAEKVFLSLTFITTALVIPAWPGSFLIAVISVIITVFWAKIPIRVLWHAFLIPLVFIIVGAITVAIQVGDPIAEISGRVYWQQFGLHISHNSLTQAASVFGHSTAGTLALLMLATSTPMVDILTWLRKLKVPAPLLEIASLTYRLIFVLFDTLQAVYLAQHNRLGFTRGPGVSGWFRPWRNTAHTMGLVLIRAWNRAQRLERGLALRGDMSQLMTTAQKQPKSWPIFWCAIVTPLAVITISVLTGNGIHLTRGF